MRYSCSLVSVTTMALIALQLCRVGPAYALTVEGVEPGRNEIRDDSSGNDLNVSIVWNNTKPVLLAVHLDPGDFEKRLNIVIMARNETPQKWVGFHVKIENHATWAKDELVHDAKRAWAVPTAFPFDKSPTRANYAQGSLPNDPKIVFRRWGIAMDSMGFNPPIPAHGGELDLGIANRPSEDGRGMIDTHGLGAGDRFFIRLWPTPQKATALASPR